MEDLLQSQIRESCKLALPDGVKELMYDISREVLRAQPKDLLKFITRYLSTLLVTRENLAVATQLCHSICDCECTPELKEELKFIGFDEEDVNAITEVILQQFKQGSVNEANLILKIVEKVPEVNVEVIPYIQEAIRNAFKKHQAINAQDYESPSDSGDDDTTSLAVKHTLRIYSKTKPGVSAFKDLATKIKSSYRAFQIMKSVGSDNEFYEEEQKNEVNYEAYESNSKDYSFSSRLPTASSISLAGSFVNFKQHHYSTGPKETSDGEDSVEYTDANTQTKKYRKKIMFKHSSTVKEFNSDEPSPSIPEVIEEIEELITEDQEEEPEAAEEAVGEKADPVSDDADSGEYYNTGKMDSVLVDNDGDDDDSVDDDKMESEHSAEDETSIQDLTGEAEIVDAEYVLESDESHLVI